MNFVTNKIFTGKSLTFDDIVKKMAKTSSVTGNVMKTAEKEEAESSGQLDVEPLHQEGESTEMPKKGPSAKKDEDTKKAKTVTDPEKEGEDSGQPKAEGSEKFTNKVKFDPNDTPDKEKGGSTEEEVKKAALEDLPEEVQEKIKGKKEKDEGEEKAEDEKDCSKASVEEEVKKAEDTVKFVKIANLNAKNKTFLKKYWTMLYGEEYANAMLADK